jgi:hypothetical protein
MRHFIHTVENAQEGLATSPVLALISKAQHEFGADKLRSGNCGTFALALGAILSEVGIPFKIGILFNQGKLEPGTHFGTQTIILAETDIYHVAVIIGNRIYDGDGEISEQAFASYAAQYGDRHPGGYLVDFDDEYLRTLIEGETNWSIPPKVFEGAMRKMVESAQREATRIEAAARG